MAKSGDETRHRRGRSDRRDEGARVTALTTFVGALLFILVFSGSVPAGPVSGVVRTVARPGVVPAPTIVYAEPIGRPAPRQPGRFTLRQKNKTFLPRVLGIPVGSSVDFPNDDMIFHNVFSLSGPQPFDLGLYRSGEACRARSLSPVCIGCSATSTR